MDVITGAAAWSEWAASNWKAVTTVLGLLYALPGKWKCLVDVDLQFRAMFGYSMALLPFSPRTRPTLLVLNAYNGAPEAADVADGLFLRFPPAGWLYKLGWPFKLFADMHPCFTSTVLHGGLDPVRPWDDWKRELTNTVDGASGRFFLCSGNAPLSLWMLLGHLLWNKGKGLMHVLVVNFRKQSGSQTFTIETSSDTSTSSAGHLLVSVPPQEAVPADAVALLYVSINASYDVNSEDVNHLSDDLGGPVRIWRLRPQSGIVNVDQANLGRIADEIREVLDDILRRKVGTLMLATSCVDAVAFVMGTLANRQMFRRVFLLEYVQGRYVKTIKM